MVVELGAGTAPPKIAMVSGGRKTVVCSWRGVLGMGVRVFQCDVELEVAARTRVACNMQY